MNLVEHVLKTLKLKQKSYEIIWPVASLTCYDTFPMRCSSIFCAAFVSIKSCFTCITIITAKPKDFKCSGLWLAKSISSNLRAWARTKTQLTRGNEHMQYSAKERNPLLHSKPHEEYEEALQLQIFLTSCIGKIMNRINNACPGPGVMSEKSNGHV